MEVENTERPKNGQDQCQMENLEVPARCGSILQHGGRMSNQHRVLIGAGARLGRKLHQTKVNQEWLS